jgi:uncharacterized protein HemY
MARLVEEPADITPNLAFTLGILALNHAANPSEARAWFTCAAHLAAAGSEIAILARRHAQVAARDAAATVADRPPPQIPAEP